MKPPNQTRLLIRRYLLAFALSASVCFSGCGSRRSNQLASERRNSQTAYDQASKLLSEQDYRSAEPLYAEALAGQLPPDMVAPAMIERAECLGGLGRIPEARTLLEESREGLASEIEYHIALGKVFRAAGEKKQAENEFKLARTLASRQRVRVQIPTVD
ncbi:tetratricopeptide repeat protein [Roseiconus lacunae]|uniref:tetratricopeptide repeat protein n=1 Tax=Roseiconus lacunae TaxID=2605694 RepID=UPI001E487073|nr:hypothetical protein [Roseiconus lacunae]MCD0462853.1 hypothetical protein [Roseiconus lacunae]